MRTQEWQCEWCGITFIGRRKRSHVYCSHSCAGKANAQQRVPGTWRTDNPSYGTVHVRMGPASDHQCECGDQAQHWAFDNDVRDGDQIDPNRGLRYSADPTRYTPKCTKCHGADSRTDRCIRGHEWTPENTYYRRDNGKRQCRTCKAEWMRRAYRKAAS